MGVGGRRPPIPWVTAVLVRQIRFDDLEYTYTSTSDNPLRIADRQHAAIHTAFFESSGRIYQIAIGPEPPSPYLRLYPFAYFQVFELNEYYTYQDGKIGWVALTCPTVCGMYRYPSCRR